MDFSVPDVIKSLVDRIRRFVQAEVYPLEKEFLRLGFFRMLPRLEEKREKVKELGLWGPQIPKAFGGLGLNLVEHALVTEELGRSPLGHFLFNCQAPDAGNMEILMQFGSAEQKEKFLQPLLRGEIRSCFGMVEPDYPGSNPAWLGTTAIEDGDHYVLTGRKWFTSSADGAQFVIVMAVTGPDAEPHERASLFIVPTDTPGFEHVRKIPVMGSEGEGHFSHSEIRFKNCRIPRANRLGDQGAGFRIAQSRLGPGRIHHCMRWVGVCERAFDLMCARASSRRLTPDRTLGSKQIVQGWIAECRAEINAARWSVLHAAWIIDLEGTKAAREEISLIKFFVANILMRVIDRAIQVHGALG